MATARHARPLEPRIAAIKLGNTTTGHPLFARERLHVGSRASAASAADRLNRRCPWGRRTTSPFGRRAASACTEGALILRSGLAADDRLYPLWRLAATTGVRRGELCGLTWRCTDLDGARLSVEQQPGFRAARSTSCATPRPPWRSRPAFPFTFWRRDSVTIRGRCWRPMPIYCRYCQQRISVLESELAEERHCRGLCQWRDHTF
jgi:hypothetical protein